MSLKSKILVLIMIPLIFFIGLGSLSVFESYMSFENDEDILSSMEYTKTLTRLVHETQKERGASAGYISGGISSSKLISQRELVDTIRNQALKKLDTIIFNEEYKNELKIELGKYTKLRDKITSKKINKTEAVREYSSIISKWIDFNRKVANHSVYGDISASIKTLQSLEFVKEFSGKLRATMTAIISENKPISNSTARKVQKLMLGVTVSIESKALTFSPSAVKLKNNFLNSKEWIETVNTYNNVLDKQSVGSYGLNSVTFMDQITRAIDKLNELIQFQLNESMTVVVARAAESRSKMISTLSAIVILSLFMIFLGLYVSKKLITDLVKISDNMESGISKINDLSIQISKNSEELSDSAGQQASSMQQTSVAMNEIDAMIKRNTGDAKSSNNIAEDSFGTLSTGVNKIKQVAMALSNISLSNDKVTNQVTSSNEKMSEITNLIKSIGDKTQVINDIVFQTKLLSFNASVEAARAGEHGKGFAVVAEEIGNLAQMSGDASKEIYEMLEESIKSVVMLAEDQKNEMDHLTLENKKNIDNGIVVSKESESFLTELVEKMENLKSSVKQISLASEEQSKGVDEVTSTIAGVTEITHSNSSISTDSNRISMELNQNLDHFNQNVLSLGNVITPRKKVA
jgi:methyl-accepting chemotaxis protein